MAQLPRPSPAFREVFGLFDVNGGGTIDAQELHSALNSVDIRLSKEEIEDVLCVMDEDGIYIAAPPSSLLCVFIYDCAGLQEMARSTSDSDDVH